MRHLRMHQPRARARRRCRPGQLEPYGQASTTVGLVSIRMQPTMPAVCAVSSVPPGDAEVLRRFQNLRCATSVMQLEHKSSCSNVMQITGEDWSLTVSVMASPPPQQEDDQVTVGLYEPLNPFPAGRVETVRLTVGISPLRGRLSSSGDFALKAALLAAYSQGRLAVGNGPLAALAPLH